MKRSDLLSFLESIGRRPNKRLSQNFLIDANVVQKIVRTAEVKAEDRILEIGSGPGALTEALLKTGAQVFAVEKDPPLAEALSRFQTPDHRLHVFCDDILRFHLEYLYRNNLKNRDFGKEAPQNFDPERASIAQRQGASEDQNYEEKPMMPKTDSSSCFGIQAPLKVVANLPYHITTPILERLFAYRDLFSSITVMVQTEMAERMQAPIGSREMSSLSLFLQFHAKPVASFPVSSACFYPQPNVGSTVLRMDLKTPPISSCHTEFFNLVRKAFQQRRKTLRSSLAPLYPSEHLLQALNELNLNKDARPEELSLDQWLGLFKKTGKPSL